MSCFRTHEHERKSGRMKRGLAVLLCLAPLIPGPGGSALPWSERSSDHGPAAAGPGIPFSRPHLFREAKQDSGHALLNPRVWPEDEQRREEQMAGPDAPPSAQRTDRDAASAQYRRVRAASEALCEPLATEDYVIQTVVETSPPKWHLAHVSWFLETFQPSVITAEPLKPTARSEEAGLAPPDPWRFARRFCEAAVLAEKRGVDLVYGPAILGEPRHSFCPVGRDSLIVGPQGEVHAWRSHPVTIGGWPSSTVGLGHAEFGHLHGEADLPPGIGEGHGGLHPEQRGLRTPRLGLDSGQGELHR